MTNEDELGKRLAGIEQRRGVREESTILETEYLELLKDYSSPQNQARIYAAIAVMYANEGMREPAKVVFYAGKAIEHGVDLLKDCQLHLYWGEALEILHPASSDDIRVISEVLNPYLVGLGLTSGQRPGAVQQLPAVGKLDHDGSPLVSAYLEAESKHQREVELRALTELNNELGRYHGLFVSKCAALFESAPGFVAALTKMVKEIVGDEAAAEILEATRNT